MTTSQVHCWFVFFKDAIYRIKNIIIHSTAPCTHCHTPDRLLVLLNVNVVDVCYRNKGKVTNNVPAVTNAKTHELKHDQAALVLENDM